MEVWCLPRRLQAWYANADFKQTFDGLDLAKLREVITSVTPDSYPNVTDTLVGNLAYTTLHCQDKEVSELAEQTLAGYVVWKRSSGCTVFNRQRLGVGMAALGAAVIGGVILYRVRKSNDA